MLKTLAYNLCKFPSDDLVTDPEECQRDKANFGKAFAIFGKALSVGAKGFPLLES